MLNMPEVPLVTRSLVPRELQAIRHVYITEIAYREQLFNIQRRNVIIEALKSETAIYVPAPSDAPEYLFMCTVQEMQTYGVLRPSFQPRDHALLFSRWDARRKQELDPWFQPDMDAYERLLDEGGF